MLLPMNLRPESLFHPPEDKIPLDQPPLEVRSQWGRWIETPEMMVAIIPPGKLEVNIRSPLNLVVTSFGVSSGIAAFNTDRLQPYQALPGGFDIVPQGSTYNSVEDASCSVVFGYSPSFLSRIVRVEAEGEMIELQPGQIPKTHWGLNVAIAMQEFFDNGQVGGVFYLESVATAVLGQIIYRRSNLSGQLKRPPEFLDPNILKSAIEYIRAHLPQALSLNHIAAKVGFSPYHFARAFKVTTGLSPYQYVLRCRLELAQQLLQNQSKSLVEVAGEVGFGNQSHMTSVFRRMLNTTPKRYRQEISGILDLHDQGYSHH
ncbi:MULTISPECIES: AraC family transcriptional regulator [unclassified Nodularia (in: cyanobacteria)]|uniref:helix-turn-helix domain-containing protein n=2 Tax=unclassified Nodularia (in: cyanobacteria) TaxID=2656917 RepID=UPI001D0FC1EF|nr:AraC family transcriptional regulator [Nodularia sp. LEGE 04288]MCC2695320.1 helix-turn-helix transcriptional regulator [Nodularia sp. LEGE 04288]